VSREVSFTVPLVPPSVNSYVRHSRGRHYVTREAKAFKEAVAILARGQTTRGDGYWIGIAIFLGKAQRGDLDNFAKVVLDALVKAAVIDSDAKVEELTLKKARDWQNPRTEITVREI
jgi:crossover junction endodeoxyribonuclease RusA